MGRLRRAARALGLVAVVVLLAGCDASEDAALTCKVDVDTPELVADREAAGIADCDSLPTSKGVSELPALELRCLGGNTTLALSDVRGPAIVNFWSTTCEPCREEMPVLQEFHERYGDQVSMIGVNYLDTYPGAAIDFARLKKVTYPSAADACGDLQSGALSLQGLPQFVFIRADGSFEQRGGGVDDLAKVVAMAEELLDVELESAEAER